MNSQNIGQILALNLTNVLKVAGSLDEDGKPKRIRSTDLQRTTRIARSTLRSLLKEGGRESNPDLKTLCKIAGELGIPVAFLLMDPQHWIRLMQAMSDMPTMLAAAGLVEQGRGIQDPLDAVKILRHAKVYPIQAPLGEAPNGNQDRYEELKLKNEQTRRSATIVAALLQPGAKTQDVRKQLTALAASIANRGVANESNTKQVAP